MIIANAACGRASLSFTVTAFRLSDGRLTPCRARGGARRGTSPRMRHFAAPRRIARAASPKRKIGGPALARSGRLAVVVASATHPSAPIDTGVQ